MPTIASANTYFDAAQQRMRAGDRTEAIKFFGQAAEEYIDVREQYARDTAMLRLINGRIDDCLRALKPPKQKVSINGSFGSGPRGVNRDDEEPPHEYKSAERPKERFSDVAGMTGVKEQLLDALVNPYKLREKFEYYKVKAPKGVLLYGPPGCGKTYVVKAAAGETGAAFFYIKLSDVVSKWVGDTEKNLAQIFKTAEANAPSIIMFDEMDSIAGDRRTQSGAYKQFVSQLLQLLDGAESLKEGVLIVGATNLPWEMDPAIIRTGRLDKCILVPPPDLEARLNIFKVHCKGRPVADSVDFNRLAHESKGFASSDIAAIVNDAATEISKEPGEMRPITEEYFIRAIERRQRPSPSLKLWLGNVRRSPKANDIPGLAEFAKSFDVGDASDMPPPPAVPADDYGHHGKGSGDAPAESEAESDA